MLQKYVQGLYVVVGYYGQYSFAIQIRIQPNF